MKGYFNFNKKEKFGVIILSSIIVVLVLVLNVGFAVSVPKPHDVDANQLEYLVLNTQRSNPFNNFPEDDNKNQSTLRKFNPNTIQLSEWIDLGFSEKQANAILTYRTNYGPFTKKEDLKKIYVINEKKYNQLAPFMVFDGVLSDDKTSNQGFNSPKSGTTTTKTNIKINSATKEDLMALNGIGEAFADRILNYRNKLGGFVELEQIEKLYISDDAKSMLKEKVIFDFENIRKTNINLANKETLKLIPYSNWAVVAEILRYRDQNEISNLDFLTDKFISPENKEKFMHYVEF
jgi:DNA uptake protein ComE-like DNA-binding protein